MSRVPLIPVDLVGMIEEDLKLTRRPADGKLHASSDLTGSLRHTMLRFVDAPERDEAVVRQIRTRTGWFWHDHVRDLLGRSGVPVLSEVDLTPWMPEGWSGTADWIFWSPYYKAFVLADLKTTKGEAIKFRSEGGMSEEHWWQTSAYYHAAVSMGLPMVKGVAVLYLPMNDSLKEEGIHPVVIEAEPVPLEKIKARMSSIKAAVDEYVDSLNFEDGEYVVTTDGLAPPLERTQKLYWDKASGQWDVKLVPHWLTDFCPYELDLCDCSTQKPNKIGHWKLVGGGSEDNAFILRYEPRKDGKFSDVEVTIKPDDKEVKRRMK